MAAPIPGNAMGRDRFGNPFANGLPYARGAILDSGELEFVKLRHARGMMAERVARGGADALFNFSGLERRMTVEPGEIYDDEITPALVGDELERLALEHLGGNARDHATLLVNRQSSALFAALIVLAKPGDVVVGISPGYTHPAVTRPAALLGTRFIDTSSVEDFERVMQTEKVAVVALTRLAVSYEIMDMRQIERVLEIARAHGAAILVDDAGGGRVGPAIFGQPRLLQLDVDLGATGLDKYGTVGPRLGLLGGKRDLVAQVTARVFEFGLEARPMLYPTVVRSLRQYSEERVRELRDATMQLAGALEAVLGQRVQRTPVSVKLFGEDTLTFAMERAGLREAPIVPYEATAALAMLLLRDHGVLTVHLAGLPPGTSALMFKFIPPETLARFGGAEKFARAVDASIEKLSQMLNDPAAIRELLFGATPG